MEKTLRMRPYKYKGCELLGHIEKKVNGYWWWSTWTSEPDVAAYKFVIGPNPNSKLGKKFLSRLKELYG